jgi:hypothetical protein
MIVHSCVLFAFVGAELTCDDARMELRVHKFIGAFGLPHNQSCCCSTDIRAVQIRADASAKHTHIARFSQAGIRARATDLFTKRESVEDLRVVLGALQVRSRVTPQHRFYHCDVHV